MTQKEQKICEDMKLAGTWREEFLPTVLMLGKLERELTQAMKAWRDNGQEFVTESINKNGATYQTKNPYYSVVCDLRKDILSYRTALGLTPTGQKKILDGLTKEKKVSKLEALIG